MFVYRRDSFYFYRIIPELINIHLLGLILWNVKIHCRELIVILIVPYLCNIVITFIIRRILTSIKEDNIT